MKVEIGISKDTITPALQRALKKMSDKRPVLEVAGKAIASMSTRAIREEDLRPSVWPPLAPSTEARKQRTGNTSPLIDTGALIRSITAQPPSRDAVEIGSDRPYAPFLQFGTSKMPARPFMPIVGEGATAKLTAKAQQNVTDAIRAKLKTMFPNLK